MISDGGECQGVPYPIVLIFKNDIGETSTARARNPKEAQDAIKAHFGCNITTIKPAS